MKGKKRHFLTPVAGAIATALNPAQQALAQDEDNDAVGLEEVIVTATKVAVNVQDIAATVQALTSADLTAMGAKGMDDYSRFIPSLSVISFGAGSSTIVFRGAVTGQGYIAQSTSSVYLDEISVTTTGSQPSIRMVDIERVEALSGPQGTLYGSDAQAGTLRIITNKPVMNIYEAIGDFELRGGSDSDASYRASAVLNLPLVEDTLALRLVGFVDHDGGFIDNVYGHTPDTPAIPWEAALGLSEEYPAGFGTLDNSHAVKKGINDADIKGARIILSWDIGENWNTSFTALTQDTTSHSQNNFDPFVGDLQTVRFQREKVEDNWQMYSFTATGDLGFAQLVGSVNYYDRERVPKLDITNYAHYWAALYCQDSAYYIAYSNAYYWKNPDSDYIVWWPVYCGGERVDSDFFSTFYEPAEQDKFTTEVRLSNQGEKIDWIAGFYYEKSNDSWHSAFAQPSNPGSDAVGSGNIYQNSASLNFWEWYWSNYYDTPTTYPETTSHWYGDSSTDWKQTALFGEFTWHISDAWDLTLGGRWFKRTNTNYYFVDHPGDLGLNGEYDGTDHDEVISDSPSRTYRLANNGNPPPRKETENEFIPKISLAWSFSDDQMLYGLYTQGIRPGGINRSRGQPFLPPQYDPDTMDNYELGYRSMFADGKGRLNATFYHMKWNDYQLELVDPSFVPCPVDGPDKIPGVCGQPWQQVVANAGDAHITGLNIELDYAFSQNWVFGGNIEFNEAETDSTIDLDGDGEIDVTKGLRLPVTPKVKGSAWLDYTKDVEWFGGTQFFSRLQASYTGDSYNILEPRGLDSPNPRFNTPSYTIADIRVGLRGESWELSLFLNNFTDERAILTIEDGYMEWGMASVQDGRPHVQRAVTNRPREFGVRYMKRWGG
jgi:outer membrane receptor protein involved in Fe transport